MSNTILETPQVDSSDVWVLVPAPRHATEPRTSPRSPAPRAIQVPDRQEARSTPSTPSWMNCLGSQVDYAPESPDVHSYAGTEEEHACINIEACVLEVKRMGWRQKWAYMRQQVQRRVRAQESLRRDCLIRAITPDRLGARSPFVEAQQWSPSTAVPSRRGLFGMEVQLTGLLGSKAAQKMEGETGDDEDCEDGWMADDEREGSVGVSNDRSNSDGCGS